MHIKTKSIKFFGRVAAIVFVLAGLIGAGIKLTHQAPSVIADSPMVEGVTPSGGMSYGTLTTYIYRVNSGTGGAPCWNGGSGCYTSHAMCLQPTKASQVGDYGYVSSTSIDAVKKIMLVSDAAVNSTIYNAFRTTSGVDLEAIGGQINSGVGAVTYGAGGSYTAGQARAFMVGHILAGAAYTGTISSGYFDGIGDYGTQSTLSLAYQTIMNWFNTNYSDAPAQFTLNTFTPNDYSHQTLGWLTGSYTPTPQTGRIQLLKYDSATGYNAALNGTGVLSGAVFRLYEYGNSGTTLANRTTNSNGYTPVYETTAGKTICFVETTAPTGYVLDTTPKCATIQANSTVYVDLANTKSTGNIRLYKTDSATSTALSGAVFRLYEQGNSGVTLATRTTGSNGYTETYTAEHGKKICFVETSAPTGYVQNTTPVCGTISGGTTVTLTLTNTKQVLNGGVTIKKVDVDTNSGSARGSAKIQGTTFTVYKSDSNGTVGASTGVTLTADANGNASTSNSALSIDPVAGGSWYCVKETSASTGYNLTDTSCKKFYLNSNGQMFSLASTPFVNKVIKGSLTITKQRKIFTEASNSWVNVPLSGVTFTLTNTADSSIKYTTGATDNNGNVTLSNIIYGTYNVVENRTSTNAAYTLQSFTITISSEGQTVTKSVLNELPDNPAIDTTARNTNSNPSDKGNVSQGDKEIEIGENAGVTDYTTFSGLEPGADYRLEGELWKINPPQERIATTRHDFTAPSGGTGNFDLGFDDVDTTSYIGEPLGIIQKLYKENGDEWLLISVHNADLTDTDEIVNVVDLGLTTTAVDDTDGDKIIEPGRAQVVRDKAVYVNLVQGRDYILVARLIDKNASKADGQTRVLRIGGNEVPAIVTKFTMPNDTEGNTTVRFPIDATEIPGRELVVFERIYEYVEGANSSNWEQVLTDLVISHEDLDNSSQTVQVRQRIGTEALDKYDEDHVIGVGMATIVDTVRLEGLAKENYKIVGYVVEKKGENGEDTEDVPIRALKENGNLADIKIEAPLDLRTATVIPEDMEMNFKFDTREFAGKELVIYEELYRVESNGTNTLLAWHKDATDANQTVKVATPKVQTTATDKADDDKELEMNEEVTITDQISYEGLVAGDTYTLVGELRDKKSGEVIELADGTTKVILVFEAPQDTGTEVMDFVIKTDDMEGKEIVVFEELYFGEWILEEVDEETGEVITPAQELTEDDKIAEHKDLNSVKQTVKVKVKIPDTGVISHESDGVEAGQIYVVPVIIAVVSLGVAVGFRLYKRRNFGF